MVRGGCYWESFVGGGGGSSISLVEEDYGARFPGAWKVEGYKVLFVGLGGTELRLCIRSRPRDMDSVPKYHNNAMSESRWGPNHGS